ncbi:DUF973 family protein [Sulfuracidifex tepidarius]|nr:DUF973 family protein [Sulfuracidifex tepidarius]
MGSISGGVASFSLYSTVPMSISSATIQGTQYYAPSTSISPASLVPGNNNVLINFGSVSLSPGVQYQILLTISNGSQIPVKVLAR